jgi:preprotein translocase subunit YajC
MVVIATVLCFLQTAPGAGGSSYIALLPMVLIFGIFYVLLFLPMQRQKKAQREMLASLQNGNVVQTSGGMIGTIVSVENDTLVLRIKPDNVRIQIARSAIAGVISEKS